METELARHLLTLCDTFANARELGEATVGRHCAADGRFFPRIRDGKTFTAKKYDEVVAWFCLHWPEGVEWPDKVPRPPIFVTEAAE
ncbi:hypothetical protein [Rhizobium sp. GCM10022189]|uniref:hypothetical protein n=1 Tax=Rhizobium sp. GCM10022189 TaxID=3252654 RepID=UPI00360B097A